MIAAMSILGAFHACTCALVNILTTGFSCVDEVLLLLLLAAAATAATAAELYNAVSAWSSQCWDLWISDLLKPSEDTLESDVFPLANRAAHPPARPRIACAYKPRDANYN